MSISLFELEIGKRVQWLLIGCVGNFKILYIEFYEKKLYMLYILGFKLV